MRVRGLAVVVSFAAASAGLFAQSQLTFHSETNYVEVDAIVTDSHGDVVRGLTPADFVLKEDRKAQTIATFDFVDLPTGAAATTGVEPRYRADMAPSFRVASGRVYLLYLDEAPASEVSRLRQQATEFVQQFLLPNDVAAVWTANSTNPDLVFSNDKAALLKPIDEYSGTEPGTVRPIDVQNAREKRLTDAITWLEGIQGRRKSLVLFTASFANAAPSCIGLLLGYPPDSLTALRSETVSFNSVTGAAQSALGSSSCGAAGWMNYPMTVASQADVHIYGVDTSGLVAPGPVPMWFSTAQEMNSGTPQAAMAINSSLDALGLSDDAILSLASATGGLALVNRNDYHQGFAKIVQDNSQYYVMGYDSPSSTGEGQFHEINLTVLRKGLTVRARKGYVGQ